MKKIGAMTLCVLLTLSLCAFSLAETKTAYKIGICNFVDDASLNQIIANIREQLKIVEQEKGVTIEILEDNCNLDSSVMQQIIANFQASEVGIITV